MQITGEIDQVAATSAPPADAVSTAVLLDMSVQALALARYFGRRGIRVIVLDTKESHWTHRTRFAEIVVDQRFRNDEYLGRYLIGLAEKLGDRPLLIPLHDDYVRFLSSSSGKLADLFRFTISSAATIEAILDKQKTSDLCRRLEIPVPKTVYVSSASEAEAAKDRVSYPAIFKPSFSRCWQTEKAQSVIQGRKVVILESSDDVSEKYAEVEDVDPRLVLQEIIPGPEHDLIYALTYVDSLGNTPGYFVGKKWRTQPESFGRGCYVESIPGGDYLALADRLIEQTHYRGSIGIEFKLDQRDNQYKLIEINARFGYWDGFGQACGFPSIEAILRDAQGESSPPAGSYAMGRKWVNPEFDLDRSVGEIRQRPSAILQTLKRYFSRHESAVFTWDDPVPGWACWIGLISQIAGRVAHRVFRRS